MKRKVIKGRELAHEEPIKKKEYKKKSIKKEYIRIKKVWMVYKEKERSKLRRGISDML